MGYSLAALGIAVGVILILLGTFDSAQRDRFNSWANQCRIDGGTVQQTYWGSLSNNYECFKDGKIINHVD